MFCSLTSMVTGCSEISLKASSMFLAEMAKTPDLSASIRSITVTMVVSASEAVTVRRLSWMSNRKLSSTGKAFLGFITLLMACRRLERAELEAMNFIGFCIFIVIIVLICSEKQRYKFLWQSAVACHVFCMKKFVRRPHYASCPRMMTSGRRVTENFWLTSSMICRASERMSSPAACP